MKPELVRFSSHPRPFHVTVIRCHAPDCDCTDVTFKFRENIEDARAEAKPMAFAVRMNGLAWKEIDPPSRPPQTARMVDEFLRDYPSAEREAIRQFCEQKLRGAQRLREYRIDPQSITEGLLISFGEILHGRPDGLAGPESWFDIFHHEEERYLVDDLYCANPECHCEKAHLVFIRHSEPDGPGNAPVAVEVDFLAALSFGGIAKIEKCHGCTPSKAEAVLSAWRERYGNDMEELRWRYEKVKEIARRSVPPRTAARRRSGFLRPDGLAPSQPSAIGARVGRNDACPCGSGKKFKKCCGLVKAHRETGL
jgi:hypothetical protein